VLAESVANSQKPSLRDREPLGTTAERALVRVAVVLSEREVNELRAALSQTFHQPLELEIETRPEILGGVWVRVGDTVIDGSLRGRLETLRHHLRAQCASMVSAGRPVDIQGTKP
jgi:vacuolar-type H+-ATPase subunit E/Vma4